MSDRKQRYLGESIKYVRGSEFYDVGEKVMIRYHIYPQDGLVNKISDKIPESVPLPNNAPDSIVVLEKPRAISVNSQQTQNAWLWLMPMIGLVIFDIVQIIMYLSNIPQ